MFVLDRSAFCIIARPSEVAKLYRSLGPVEIAPDGLPEQKCLGFACLIRRESGDEEIYAVVYPRHSRTSRIYFPQGGGTGNYGPTEGLAKAREFLTEMGFELEKVNLNVNSLLRDVLIRDVPAILSPESASKKLMEKSALDREREMRAQRKFAESREQEEQSAQSRRLRAEQEANERQASERARAARLAAEREASEQAESTKRAEALAAAERAERQRLEAELEKLRSAKDPVPDFDNDPRLTEERAERQRLEEELKRLQAEMLAGEKAEEIAAVQAEAIIKAEQAAAEEQAERARLEAELDRLRAEKAAAEAAVAAAAAERELLAAEKSRRETLQGQLDQLAAEKMAAEEELARKTEAARVATEEVVQIRAEREELAAEKTRREALQAQLDRLSAEKAAAEQKLAEKTEAAKVATEEIAQIRAEREELLADKDRLVAEMLAAEEQAANQAQQTRQAAETAESARQEAEQLARERAEAAHQAEERLAAERAEKESLAAEKAVAEAAARKQEEVARRVLEKALKSRREAEERAQELSRLVAAGQSRQAKIETEQELQLAEKLARERTDAVKAAEDDLASARLQADRLAAEHAAAVRLAEERAESEKAERRKLQAELERLLLEKSAAEEEAARRIEAARKAADQAESERLALERALSEQQAAQEEGGAHRRSGLPPLYRKSSPPVQAPLPKDHQSFLRGSKGPTVTNPSSPPKPRRSSAGPFHVEWDMERIDFRSPREVVEVHQSINQALISLENFPPQNCSGSVVILERDGRRSVYVAFHLKMDQRVLVYAPGEKPRDETEFRRMRSAALQYLELSGFMVDPVSLPDDPEKRQKILAEITVMRHTEGRASNF